jgi:uncharacterized protein (TIGR02118 family)
MYKLTVLYTRIDDREGFDAHFHGTHLPIAARTPGLRELRVTGYDVTPDGAPSIPVIVELLFDTADAAEVGMASEPQQQAVADFMGMIERYGIEAQILRGEEQHVPLVA